MKPFTLNEVLAWSGDADARRSFSPLAEQPYLLFEAEGELSANEQALVRAWLRELPCPVLGVAGGASALTPACDVVLADADEAGALLDNIRSSPIAAAVLVQLLRATETLAIADALVAESLAYSTLQAGPEFRHWLEANRAPAPAVHGDEGPAVVIGREDGTLMLELNRASNRNGMTVEMRDALVEALQLVLSDDSIHQVRLSGRGKCFSTGGDLSEFGTAPDPATAHAVRSLALPGRLLAACAARVEARLHGACIGSGLEFPAFAGRVVARSSTHFQLPELKLGLIPGAGGCVSIARRIGRQRTAWLVLSGERIRATRALDWGLVDAIDDSW